MKISVAMTTYNGEKYIVKQLDSLRDQTMRIDEVIIYDDCSSDKTAGLIMEYIKTNNLINWEFNTNSSNIGWVKNFHNCIKKTTGDFIFFCDQDDVWHKDKVETMITIMENNPNISVLSCKANLIDENENRIHAKKGGFIHVSNKTGKVLKEKIDDKFVFKVSPGCMLAIRKKYLILENYEESKEIFHDELYWKAGIISDEAYTVDRALIDYRIHENNASNPSADAPSIEIKTKNKRITEAEWYMTRMQNIYSVLSKYREEKREILNQYNGFCKNRFEFLSDMNFFKGWHFLFHNWKYYNSNRMIIGDIIGKLIK